MFRFTIRDVLWLTVVVALGVGWGIEHRRAAARDLRLPGRGRLALGEQFGDGLAREKLCHESGEHGRQQTAYRNVEAECGVL